MNIQNNLPQEIPKSGVIYKMIERIYHLGIFRAEVDFQIWEKIAQVQQADNA